MFALCGVCQEIFCKGFAPSLEMSMRHGELKYLLCCSVVVVCPDIFCKCVVPCRSQVLSVGQCQGGGTVGRVCQYGRRTLADMTSVKHLLMWTDAKTHQGLSRPSRACVSFRVKAFQSREDSCNIEVLNTFLPFVLLWTNFLSPPIK